MALTERDYSKLLSDLLPRGPIWDRSSGTAFDALLYASAKEFARVDSEIETIFTESDPRTSSRLIQQWFDDWGVPSACLSAFADPTLEQIRQELIAKITSNSGLTARFFIELSQALGYQVEIETFTPYDVTCLVDAGLYGDDWTTVFVMNIHVASDTDLSIFDATWSVDQPLAVFGESVLECVIRSLIPAHTDVIFSYGDSNDTKLLG